MDLNYACRKQDDELGGELLPSFTFIHEEKRAKILLNT